MTAEQVWGIARTILAAGGGYLIAKGVIDEATLTAILGGLGTVFVAGWSWYIKKPKAV